MGNFNILLVDDEPDILDILKYIFLKKGYNIFTASNGKEAYEIVKRERIDAVISDIRMPGGDGIELLSNIKKHNERLPVVLFISGHTDMSLEDAYDKGAEAIFSKPFDKEVLEKAVEKVLETMSGPTQNKRHLRQDVGLEIEVRFPNFERFLSTTMQNLGRGGFFVTLEDKFPRMEDKVQFKFHYDNNGTKVTIEDTAIVRWVRAQKEGDLLPGCGVEFLFSNKNEREKLLELVNFLTTNHFIPKS